MESDIWRFCPETTEISMAFVSAVILAKRKHCDMSDFTLLDDGAALG